MSMTLTTDRAEALRLFEAFLDKLAPDQIRQIAEGKKVMTLLSIDEKASSLRRKPIDEAYAVLDGTPAADIKKMIKAPPLPSTKKDCVDFLLTILHGQPYFPPPPTMSMQNSRSTRKKASPKEKAAQPSWNAQETAAVLKRMTSASEATGLLSPRAVTIEKLKELAKVIGLKLEKSLKAEIIYEIVYATVIGPRTLDRAQNG